MLGVQQNYKERLSVCTKYVALVLSERDVGSDFLIHNCFSGRADVDTSKYIRLGKEEATRLFLLVLIR
jgi:hypothetical protein